MSRPIKTRDDYEIKRGACIGAFPFDHIYLQYLASGIVKILTSNPSISLQSHQDGQQTDRKNQDRQQTFEQGAAAIMMPGRCRLFAGVEHAHLLTSFDTAGAGRR